MFESQTRLHVQPERPTWFGPTTSSAQLSPRALLLFRVKLLNIWVKRYFKVFKYSTIHFCFSWDIPLKLFQKKNQYVNFGCKFCKNLNKTVLKGKINTWLSYFRTDSKQLSHQTSKPANSHSVTEGHRWFLKSIFS